MSSIPIPDWIIKRREEVSHILVNSFQIIGSQANNNIRNNNATPLNDELHRNSLDADFEDIVPKLNLKKILSETSWTSTKTDVGWKKGNESINSIQVISPKQKKAGKKKMLKTKPIMKINSDCELQDTKEETASGSDNSAMHEGFILNLLQSSDKEMKVLKNNDHNSDKASKILTMTFDNGEEGQSCNTLDSKVAVVRKKRTEEKKGNDGKDSDEVIILPKLVRGKRTSDVEIEEQDLKFELESKDLKVENIKEKTDSIDTSIEKDDKPRNNTNKDALTSPKTLSPIIHKVHRASIDKRVTFAEEFDRRQSLGFELKDSSELTDETNPSDSESVKTPSTAQEISPRTDSKITRIKKWLFKK